MRGIFLEFDELKERFEKATTGKVNQQPQVQVQAYSDSVRNNIVIGIRITKYSLVVGKSICLCVKPLLLLEHKPTCLCDKQS